MVAPSSRGRIPFALAGLAAVCLACGAGGKKSPADPGIAELETSATVEEETESEPMSPSTAIDSGEDAESSTTSIEVAGYPEVEIPESETPAGDDDDSAATGSAPNAPASDADPAKDSTLTIIEAAGEDEDSGDRSLVDAAAAERARRQTAAPSSIVITDKNLSEYAVGQLTVTGPAQTAEATAVSAELEERESEEEYWRSRGREIRSEWAEAAERVDELEAEVFHLRQRFYAEDDGFYRDSQIKPAWDRAIEELQETKDRIEEIQEELAQFLEDGREAAALPGWLRDGVELEPEVEPKDDGVYVEPDGNELEPGEPVVVDEYEQDSGS